MRGQNWRRASTRARGRPNAAGKVIMGPGMGAIQNIRMQVPLTKEDGG